MSLVDASTWQELATNLVLIGAALGALRQWVVNPLIGVINGLREDLAQHDAEHRYLKQLPDWTHMTVRELDADREMRGLEPLPTPPRFIPPHDQSRFNVGDSPGDGGRWPDAQPGPSAHT